MPLAYVSVVGRGKKRGGIKHERAALRRIVEELLATDELQATYYIARKRKPQAFGLLHSVAGGMGPSWTWEDDRVILPNGSILFVQEEKPGIIRVQTSTDSDWIE